MIDQALKQDQVHTSTFCNSCENCVNSFITITNNNGLRPEVYRCAEGLAVPKTRCQMWKKDTLNYFKILTKHINEINR